MAKKPVKPPSTEPLYSRAALLEALELVSRVIPEDVKLCLYCHFENEDDDCWHLPYNIRLRVWKQLTRQWPNAAKSASFE